MIEPTHLEPVQDLELNKNSQNPYWNIVFHSVVTFLGQSLMQVVDLLFCRDLGSTASATVGTATSLFAWFMIVGLGLVSSLEFFIPNSLGAGDEKKAHSYYYAGVAVAVLVSLFSTFALAGLVQGVELFGINPELRESVQHFCYIIAASYLPVFLVPVLRVELQARGYPHDSTYAFAFANALNILLNWVLVLGHLGSPALGIIGSAWANLLSRYGLLAYLLLRTYFVRSKLSIPVKPKEIPFKKFFKEIVVMGAPTSLHLLFEIGAFAFVGTLAARLTAVQNAAHAISLSLASFVFMIPMGLSSAAALTMSKANGMANAGHAIHLGYKTIYLGLAYALIGSIAIVFFRYPLMEMYTSDAGTIQIGASLLFVAAIFQFGDSMQVILAGCIRGFGQTRIQATMNAIGHWLIGIPLGMLLCFHFDMGIKGLWIGLCSGLFSVAIGLYFYWRRLKLNTVYASPL
jgi:MATE family multidrug resistance protein